MNVEFKSVDLNIKKEEILKGINLKFEPGKIYGLLGRNGAGKTTLLSLIATYRKVTDGALTVDGEDPYENERVMPFVDFLHQGDYSEESDSVEDYLKLIMKYKPSFDMEYALSLLGEYGIDIKKKMMDLSQGQQAAVTATLGLASLSKVTIFDEVTNGMDAPTRELFYSEVLEAANREERIIILSTHIISEMEHLFDEIIMIHKGQVLLQESTDELLEKGYTVAGKAERVRAFTENKNVINVKFLGALQIDTVLGTVTPEEMEIAADDHLDISPLKLQEMFISLTDKQKDGK